MAVKIRFWPILIFVGIGTLFYFLSLHQTNKDDQAMSSRDVMLRTLPDLAVARPDRFNVDQIQSQAPGPLNKLIAAFTPKTHICELMA